MPIRTFYSLNWRNCSQAELYAAIDKHEGGNFLAFFREQAGEYPESRKNRIDEFLKARGYSPVFTGVVGNVESRFLLETNMPIARPHMAHLRSFGYEIGEMPSSPALLLGIAKSYRGDLRKGI
jgi:hypothetical protein